ncbi:hypothetical protein FOZ63_032647, partial [Perkinsus olseni]
MASSSYYLFFAKYQSTASKGVLSIQSLLETKKDVPLDKIRTVGVYLHGFPDSGVRPVRCSGELQRKAEAGFLPLTRADSPKVLHGSRMSSKMSEAVLSSTESNDMAFCSFNTNGVPNSG